MQNVNQLRDPAIFEEDGEVYLLYSIRGEQVSGSVAFGSVFSKQWPAAQYSGGQYLVNLLPTTDYRLPTTDYRLPRHPLKPPNMLLKDKQVSIGRG